MWRFAYTGIASGVTVPHNVIRGEFAVTGKTDWVVLCSKGGASTVLVFWNGRKRNPGRIGRAEDGDLFTRQITALGRKEIEEHYRALVDHEGIGDASAIHYYVRGKWLELGK